VAFLAIQMETRMSFLALRETRKKKRQKRFGLSRCITTRSGVLHREVEADVD
jgi:hypothetical protein